MGGSGSARVCEGLAESSGSQGLKYLAVGLFSVTAAGNILSHW